MVSLWGWNRSEREVLLFIDQVKCLHVCLAPDNGMILVFVLGQVPVYNLVVILACGNHRLRFSDQSDWPSVSYHTQLVIRGWVEISVLAGIHHKIPVWGLRVCAVNMWLLPIIWCVCFAEVPGIVWPVIGEARAGCDGWDNTTTQFPRAAPVRPTPRQGREKWGICRTCCQKDGWRCDSMGNWTCRGESHMKFGKKEEASTDCKSVNMMTRQGQL